MSFAYAYPITHQGRIGEINLEPFCRQKVSGLLPSVSSQKVLGAGDIKSLDLKFCRAAANLSRQDCHGWSHGLIQHRAASSVHVNISVSLKYFSSSFFKILLSVVVEGHTHTLFTLVAFPTKIAALKLSLWHCLHLIWHAVVF